MIKRADMTVHRWLAVGLLFFVVLLFVLVGIVPFWFESAELNEQKEELAFRLQRYERILANRSAVSGNREEIRKQFNSQGYFNQQATPALASAALQKLVKRAITNSGGQLTSTQALADKKQDRFIQVQVKVRMTGTINALQNALYQLEGAKPLVIINSMDIRPLPGKRNRKTRKIEPNGKLNINFQVVSFLRGAGHE